MEDIKEKLEQLNYFIIFLGDLENKFDPEKYKELILHIQIYITNNFQNNLAILYILKEINRSSSEKELKKTKNNLKIIVTSIENNNLSDYISQNLIPELINLLNQADSMFVADQPFNFNKFGIWESDVRDYLEKHDFKPNYRDRFLYAAQDRGKDIRMRTITYSHLLKDLLYGLLEEGKNLLKVKNQYNHEINNQGVNKSIQCHITGSKCAYNNIELNKNQIFLAYDYKNEEIEEIINKEIIPLLKESGLNPIRAKDKIVNYDFMCKICRQIQESEYLLADISANNLNVGLELGIAIGLQKITMIMANKDSPEIGDLKRTDSIKYLFNEIDKLRSDFLNMIKNVIKE